MRSLTTTELEIAFRLRSERKSLRVIAKTIGRRLSFVSDALRRPKARAQDRICAELNGHVPAGGCRYPYCECKG